LVLLKISLSLKAKRKKKVTRYTAPRGRSLPQHAAFVPMKVLVGVTLFIALFTGLLTWLHAQMHGLFSPLQFALAAFCVLNATYSSARGVLHLLA